MTIHDIREHAEVIGNDGRHVGTVDRIEGDRIKLTKSDSQGAGHQGHHHFIELSLVETVQENRVHLSVPADEAVQQEEEESGSRIH
ncbi:DUF2171 domain-containing protein [Rhizobium sp. FKL33]|uniref:DUF2171 domain-containing protein n=1 Tax=Rhizobium sp. FKL33 TaxID=2562307 RepID=UPI0014859B2B|nr:DUF2171 domain-containing protein [Rhizobium sp. FKL33]